MERISTREIEILGRFLAAMADSWSDLGVSEISQEKGGGISATISGMETESFRITVRLTEDEKGD